MFVTALGGLSPARADNPVPIHAPEIAKDRIFDISRFGAIADGTTSCTTAIQKAIDAARDAGGGRVEIPAGHFLSGPIVLASNLDFHLAKDAVLLMSDNPAEFPPANNRRPAFISANDAHDLRISGGGTVDGQGAVWWKPFREDKSKGTPDLPRRPQLIALTRCERVEVQGITTLNPPNTHYSLAKCQDLVIRDITAIAPAESPNTDALNLSGVRNVLITGCHISTGDDNIVLLSGATAQPGMPEVENIMIRDCRLGDGHGLSIGSYTSGGVRNVHVENITFDGTTSGIRMKAWRDRGGIVEGIHYRNLVMTRVRYPIFLSSYYPSLPAAPSADLPAAEKDSRLPVWKDIEIDGVTLTDCKNSIIVWGLPDQPFTNVSFNNIKGTAQAGAKVFHAKAVTFSAVEVAAADGLPLSVFDAEVTGLQGAGFTDAVVKFK